MPGKVVSTGDLMGGVAAVLMGPLCCALLFAAFVTMLVHPGALVLLNVLGCQTAEQALCAAQGIRVVRSFEARGRLYELMDAGNHDLERLRLRRIKSAWSLSVLHGAQHLLCLGVLALRRQRGRHTARGEQCLWMLGSRIG